MLTALAWESDPNSTKSKVFCFQGRLWASHPRPSRPVHVIVPSRCVSLSLKCWTPRLLGNVFQMQSKAWFSASRGGPSSSHPCASRPVPRIVPSRPVSLNPKWWTLGLLGNVFDTQRKLRQWQIDLPLANHFAGSICYWQIDLLHKIRLTHVLVARKPWPMKCLFAR